LFVQMSRNDEREGSEMHQDDRWRIWRVTEPEPEHLRSVSGRRRPHAWPDLPVRRWWHV